MFLRFKKIILAIINLQYYKSYLNLVCPLFEVKEIFDTIKKIDILLDVGSNKGQFSVLLLNYFPRAKIHSFEPQRSAMYIQRKILPKNTTFYNLCLGNKNSVMNLNVTKKKDSSSLLSPKHLKKSIYEVIQKIEVKVKKLDDLLSLPSKQKIIMKLDVQGYEKEVLMGAIKNLKKIDYILVELSSSSVYKKQSTKRNIVKFLKNNNFFLLKELNKGSITKNIYQTDCLFHNKKIGFKL